MDTKFTFSLINYIKYRLKINHYQIDKNIKRWIIFSAGKDMERRVIM